MPQHAERSGLELARKEEDLELSGRVEARKLISRRLDELLRRVGERPRHSL